MIEIELNNVKKNYGLKNVLDGLNFEVKTGERVALIGENGSGKSTILKLIAKEEKVDFGVISIRKEANIGYLKQIYLDDKDDPEVKKYLERSFEEYFLIEEKLKTLEKLMTTGENLDSVMKKYGRLQEEYIAKGGYELSEKFSKICSGFKFTDEFLKQKYNMLSGGEKSIVNLAAILLKNPSILLLDEPTNHLDVEAIEWLEEFLSSYKGSVLLISHDRFFLDKVVNKIVLLERGKADIYFGNYSYFVDENERRTLREFEEYKNQQKQIEKMKEAIKKLKYFGSLEGNERFFKRAKCIERKLENLERLDKVSLEKRRLPIDIHSVGKTGKDVVIIENLNKNYGEKSVFKNFNMGVYAKEKVHLNGKNGSGKSTLINMILGNDTDYTGKIKINPSVKIGYIPQIIKFENEKETIYDYFAKQYSKSQTEIRTYLAKYMFYGNSVFKRLEELSGGERVRLLLSNLVLKETNFLILDEPTNHLDINSREELEETLKEYKGTILFVSHDRYFTEKLATREIKI